MQHDLYKINQQLLECIDLETGEILDMERVEQLNMQRDEQIDQFVLMRKNAMAEIAGIKSEIDNLKSLADSKQKLVNQLESWINEALGGENFKPESGLYEIKYTHSKSVEAYDMDALLAYDITGKYVRFAKPEPAKAEIKKALNAGEVIPGCRIIENSNMNIK